MDLINEMQINQEKSDELNELGLGLSPEQIEHVKYEAVGRALTKKVNILNAESGRIITTDFFDGLLMTTVSRFSSRDAFIITPDIQPLFNIKNEYMGFLDFGKIRNLKKEKQRAKNIRRVLSATTAIMAFIVGFTAPFISTIAFIIGLMAFGGLNLVIGRE